MYQDLLHKVVNKLVSSMNVSGFTTLNNNTTFVASMNVAMLDTFTDFHFQSNLRILATKYSIKRFCRVWSCITSIDKHYIQCKIYIFRLGVSIDVYEEDFNLAMIPISSSSPKRTTK
jgi:hypothetical protein